LFVAADYFVLGILSLSVFTQFTINQLSCSDCLNKGESFHCAKYRIHCNYSLDIPATLTDYSHSLSIKVVRIFPCRFSTDSAMIR